MIKLDLPPLPPLVGGDTSDVNYFCPVVSVNEARSYASAYAEQAAKEAHAVCLDLYVALDALFTDMIIAQGNMRDAAKRDPRWEGCAEEIQPRIDAARTALARYQARGQHRTGGLT